MPRRSQRQLTDDEAAELRRLWDEGMSRQEIARRFGVSQSSIFDRGRAERGKGVLAHPSLAFLPNRQGKGGGRLKGDDWRREDGAVSEAEAEERRRAVFAAWTEDVRKQRFNAGPINSDHPPSRTAWADEPRRGAVSFGRLDVRPRNW